MKRGSPEKRTEDDAGLLLVSPARGSVELQLDQLKEQLLGPILKSVPNALLVRELRRVANEAAAMAWCTVCPVLMFPVLLEEKIRATTEWWARQERLRQRFNPQHHASTMQALPPAAA